MKQSQLENLHVMRSALESFDGEGLPRSVSAAVVALRDEVEEALPVGDLGERPIVLNLGALRAHKEAS